MQSMSSRRIHPSDAAGGRRARRHAAADRRRPAVYTVWKRSSMGFHCTDGFCVYDAEGGLAFRVDNYSRRRKLRAGELLLMDGRGAPLLSLRPQLLSLHDRWNCYIATEEESPCSSKKQSSSSSSPLPPPQLVFTMHKTSALGSSDHMATSTTAPTTSASASAAGLGCKP